MSKKIYNHLSSEYKSSVIRSFLQFWSIDNNYSEEYIGRKKLPQGDEEIAEIIGITEENYKELLLKLLKEDIKYTFISRIEKKYKYFRSISENATIEDIEKSTVLKTDISGEKYILVGCLKNGEYDNSAYGYCLSPRDEIRGRVVKIYLSKSYNNSDEKEVKTTYVCDTAILKCPKLKEKEYLKLKVTSQDSWYIEDLLKATEEDFVGNINIIPEDGIICPQTKNKCVPETSKWENTSNCDSINGSFSLTSDSKCKCNVGKCYLTIVDSKSKDYLE